jgi:hypothetical protein
MASHIDPFNRAEFEQLGAYEVRRRAQASLWAETKLAQAWAWLDEQEHGEERAQRRATLLRSNIALTISGIALVVGIVATVVTLLRG